MLDLLVELEDDDAASVQAGHGVWGAAATIPAASGVREASIALVPPTPVQRPPRMILASRLARLLLAAHGFAVECISSVEPGAYGDEPATTESPELLVIARRS